MTLTHDLVLDREPVDLMAVVQQSAATLEGMRKNARSELQITGNPVTGNWDRGNGKPGRIEIESAREGWARLKVCDEGL